VIIEKRGPVLIALGRDAMLYPDFICWASVRLGQITLFGEKTAARSTHKGQGRGGYHLRAVAERGNVLWKPGG